jgi:hypothetical protein
MTIRAPYVLAAAVLALAGCSPPSSTLPPPSGGKGPPTDMMGPTAFATLPPCPAGLNPTRAFVLKIKNLNVKKLDHNGSNHTMGFLVYPVMDVGDGYDADESAPNPQDAPDPGATTNKTRWDISFQLTANAPTALVKIEIADSENHNGVNLRADAFTILEEPASSPDYQPFCAPQWLSGPPTNTGKQVIFLAQYKPQLAGKLTSFNIGLFVGELSTSYVTPIFIDPNVKNNG